MRTMCAPARDNAANARSNAAPTSASMPSSTILVGTANRRPAKPAATGTAGASPASTASITAQQATLGASGPTESRLGANGSTPSDRHTPRRGFVADDAAERRGNAAGTAGVGAQPRNRHAIRNRHRGAGRTAAGNACRRAIPGRSRRAVMRIDAEAGERELRHVGASHRHEAGSQHALHHRCMRGCRRRVGEHARAGRCRLAGDIEQVLQADRDAGIAARRAADTAQRIHRIGHRARLLGMHLDEGARSFAIRFRDACQTRFHQRAAGHRSGRQTLSALFDRLHGLRHPLPVAVVPAAYSRW